MPNWCNNKLQLQCSEERFKEFTDKFVIDGILSFNTVIPQPPELDSRAAPERDEVFAKAMLAKYGAKDWYDWRVGNWGTKWEPEIIDIDGHCIVFDSAWAPPIAAIVAMSKQFPDIAFELTYFEPGMCFAGRTKFLDGKQDDDYTKNPHNPMYKTIAAEMGWYADADEDKMMTKRENDNG